MGRTVVKHARASAPIGHLGASDTIPPAATTPTARDRPSRWRRRRLSADVLSSLCVLSVAAAVALYLASGGISQVKDVASALTMAGIVAGLVGSDLVLVMMVLAARIPAIDRTFGQDVAMAVHGRLGKPAFYLLLGHAVLLTLGYAATDRTNVVSETVSLLATEDLPLAYVGLGLLVVVIVTSVVTVRRRLPYEVWHVIHLLTYGAVLMALPHQFSSGAVLGAGTAQRVYWIGLYVVAFGAIAYFRFALPLYRSVRHDIRVTAVEEIAPGVVSIHLGGRDLERLQTAGGQYAVWRFWTRSTWWHEHPISFSSVPTSTAARITIRGLGAGSRSVGRVHPGTKVSFAGPYGIFTDRARTSPYLSVVAAGIGVTPVRSLLENSPVKPGEATVLLRASDESETYLWDEVFGLSQSMQAQVYWTLGKRPSGVDAWMSAEDHQRGVRLESVFPRLLDSDLYICGPRRWAELVLADAQAAGLRPEQIHIERFDW